MEKSCNKNSYKLKFLTYFVLYFELQFSIILFHIAKKNYKMKPSYVSKVDVVPKQ